MLEPSISLEACTTHYHRTTGRCRLRGGGAFLLMVFAGVLSGGFFAPPAWAQDVTVKTPSQRAPTPVLVGCIQFTGQINLNSATVDQLVLLPGVGPTTANAILRYRQRVPFRRVRQIRRVRGIGPKKYRRLKAHVTVKGENTFKKWACGRKKPSSADAATTLHERRPKVRSLPPMVKKRHAPDAAAHRVDR